MQQQFDLQQIACKVYGVLTDMPETRDDDRILLACIWLKEFGDTHKDSESFINQFIDGSLSNPESVTRVRRKLQEMHENLRGQKWDVRHQMEGAVCQQLTFFDKW